MISILLKNVEDKISKQSILNEAVSKSSVGWHIEHSLLTINGIIEKLNSSNSNNYKWRFNFTKTLVFTLNKIPRGRAQSPSSVIPHSDMNEDTLRIHFNKTMKKLEDLNSLQPNQYFDHPIFGMLNLKPTIKFLEIHTKHHLDIMDDIIDQAK